MSQVKGELFRYRAVFEDGKIETVIGRWASHAWAVAQHMRPNHQIKGLALLGEYKPAP
jgi:hypothetical protein